MRGVAWRGGIMRGVREDATERAKVAAGSFGTPARWPGRASYWEENNENKIG